MTHPTFPDLYDHATGADHIDAGVADHVDACGLCQMAVASIRGESTSATWELAPSSPASEDLPALAAGQVWRLEWSGDTSHVLVVDIDDATVDVLPVVEDPELIEGLLVQWPAGESPVGFAAGVWPGPRVTILSFLFDRYYDQIAVPELPESPAAPTPYSPAAAAVVDAVVSRLESLRASDWVPESDGEDWDSALESAGVSYVELAEALGLTNAEIDELVSGVRLVGDEERLAIANLLGRSPDDLPGAAAIPFELVLAMNRPQVRSDIRSKAVELGVDEASARQKLARDFATADHRTAKKGSPREFWERVVDDYFHR